MSTQKPNALLKHAALVLALALAPAAQAESRDTGVGLLIAAQGNQALEQIREEVRAAVRQLKPVLPARPARPVAVATSYGAARSVVTTQRSAK